MTKDSTKQIKADNKEEIKSDVAPKAFELTRKSGPNKTIGLPKSKKPWKSGSKRANS
jgi:hypothetical protein